MAPYCQDLNKPSSDEQSVSLIICTDTFLVKTGGPKQCSEKSNHAQYLLLNDDNMLGEHREEKNILSTECLYIKSTFCTLM